MKITRIETYYIPLGYEEPFAPAWSSETKRRLGVTVVKIFTDEGITGIGGTHSHAGSFAGPDERGFDDFTQVLTVEQQVKPYLLGEDPFLIHKHLQTVRGASLFGCLPWFVMVALWDIVGKACGQPLFRLWGANRERVKPYVSTVKLLPPEERAKFAEKVEGMGFRGMKLRFHRESLGDDLEVFDAVKNQVGDDFSIMVDANQVDVFPKPDEKPVWDYRTAYEAARVLGKGGAEWLEEPLPATDYDGLLKLRRRTNLPLAGGEGLQGLGEVKNLLRKGVYDIIQPDPLYSGGYLQIIKFSALAEADHLTCNPHCWSNGLGLAANLHLAASIPNCEWVEYPYDPPYLTQTTFQKVLTEPIEVDPDGLITVPTKPGLGVEVNEELIEEKGRSFQDLFR